MADADDLLVRIGLLRRQRKNTLRLGLKWSVDRLNSALDELEAEGRIAVNSDGVVRTLNLSNAAERIFNALPSTGEARSGDVLKQQLGLTASAFNLARTELKGELLVTSKSGRGSGTLQRAGVAESMDEERMRLLGEQMRLEVDVVIAREALEELFHACFIEPHEGVYPSYGAVIVSDIEDLGGILGDHELQTVGGFQVLDDLRPFADGMNSFVLRDLEAEDGRLLLTPDFRGLERDVVDLSTLLQGVVVQRNRAGVVRLITSDAICIRENGVWTKKTRAGDFLSDVLIALAREDLAATADGLLTLCLHVLSPNHVGATLVWFTDREAVPQTGPNRVVGLGWSKAFPPPPLLVTEERHGPLILHSLAQVDRAAIVNEGGEVIWLGVNLDPTESLSVEGGTRHNSAASFSAEHSDAMIFVVSADGPVTIFHEGAVIRTTRR